MAGRPGPERSSHDVEARPTRELRTEQAEEGASGVASHSQARKSVAGGLHLRAVALSRVGSGGVSPDLVGRSQTAVDGASSEPVFDHAAQEIWIRTLQLLGFGGDFGGKANT